MLLDQSLIQLNTGLKDGKFSSEDLIQEALSNIKNLDPKLNSLITVSDEKQLLAQAKKTDEQKTFLKHPLAGLPFVLKDAYVTKDITTTAASKILSDFTPPYNATVYQKLLDAGAILIAKANLDAWGHGGSNENSDYNPVHNPWDLERVSGGSSGGCGAAVAARLCAFAIGEDTGGSIRNPSSWCNLTGLKPSYGRVSRYGAIAYASSFDCVGPMAKSAQDCAIILETIAGLDPNDATSLPKKVPFYSQKLNQDLAGKTIGLPQQMFEEGLDPRIKSLILNALKHLEKLGLKIKPVSMPIARDAIALYYLVGPSETSSNLARFDGVRYGKGRKNFSDESMRRIMLGTYTLSAGYYDAYYKKALKVRTLLKQEYAKLFKQVDAILMPVTPTPATKIGQLSGNLLQNLLIDIYTTSQNPAGVPSLALPCGFVDGLPVGFQLTGDMFTEDLLFALGHQYQQISGWHAQKPPLLEISKNKDS